VIIFGFVRFLSKKKRSNKLVFLKKNRNWFKPTGFGLVGYFRKKTGSTWFFGLTRFFLVCLGFFDLVSFFSGLA
jgi:hypothetical protein